MSVASVRPESNCPTIPGRLTSDAVTTLGSGVDGSVRRIAYAYDTQGNL
jgi:hypothetical protein